MISALFASPAYDTKAKVCGMLAKVINVVKVILLSPRVGGFFYTQILDCVYRRFMFGGFLIFK
ncbi:hypothetical protein [Peptostreptococcus russellii]|uniref:hypothetical protein n=1 Tax=Peptostreptococcus russellii TaxID=215200 RepID=UPI0011B22686|nr:hypothetical protein [Peptostreptococcus russellii]